MWILWKRHRDMNFLLAGEFHGFGSYSCCSVLEFYQVCWFVNGWKQFALEWLCLPSPYYWRLLTEWTLIYEAESLACTFGKLKGNTLDAVNALQSTRSLVAESLSSANNRAPQTSTILCQPLVILRRRPSSKFLQAFHCWLCARKQGPTVWQFYISKKWSPLSVKLVRLDHLNVCVI